MGEENSKPTSSFTKDTIISDELSKEVVALVDFLFNYFGLVGYNIPPQYDAKDSFSQLTRSCINVQTIHPGKVSCVISVKPAISIPSLSEQRVLVPYCCLLYDHLRKILYTNVYRNMHGGAVGAVAERVSIACARTAVGKDKELFLGELRMSYLSAAPTNAEVVIEGSIIRSGRNITVVAVDFRLKDSRKLVYTSNATFYHMPVASL